MCPVLKYPIVVVACFSIRLFSQQSGVVPADISETCLVSLLLPRDNCKNTTQTEVGHYVNVTEV